MKTKTKADYTAKMRRRPAPKKGKSRKDHAMVNRESNTALVAKNQALAMECARLNTVGVILDRALRLACRETRHDAEFYIDAAEKELKDER